MFNHKDPEKENLVMKDNGISAARRDKSWVEMPRSLSKIQGGADPHHSMKNTGPHPGHKHITKNQQDLFILETRMIWRWALYEPRIYIVDYENVDVNYSYSLPISNDAEHVDGSDSRQ
jgi:hypothetical protein